MSYKSDVPVSYVCEEDGILYEGKLPNSAIEQFDLYTALIAYWDSKDAKSWAAVRNYVLAHTKITEKATGVVLDPAKDISFQQLKLAIDKYLSMATDFFASPQKKEQK